MEPRPAPAPAPSGPSTVLRPRLRVAAEMVPPGSRVADIGSGHGLLPRALLASGRASHCIASERSPRTLARVWTPPGALPGARRLELRVGDGLRVLRAADRVDVALLLGMGAVTIGRILDARDAAARAIPRLVIQPQTDWAGLRAGLLRRGLAIVDERLVEDRGRTYLVLAAEPDAGAALPAHAELTAEELLEVGPLLAGSGDPLLLGLWRRELRRRGEITRRATGDDLRQARRAWRRARRIVEVLGRVAAAPAGETRPIWYNRNLAWSYDDRAPTSVRGPR